MAAIGGSEKRSVRVNLRATSSQDALIRAAARVRGVNVTDYLLDSACRQAEIDLADGRHFVLPPERMAAFNEALDRPVRDKPRLRRLFAEPGEPDAG